MGRLEMRLLNSGLQRMRPEREQEKQAFERNLGLVAPLPGRWLMDPLPAGRLGPAARPRAI